jgi:hypothetical protein
MRRALAAIVATGLLAGLCGCITPSIPIPPPDPAEMTFTFSGTGAVQLATFEYSANTNYIGTIVYVYNRDREVGIIEGAHSDGSVGPTAPVSAVVGDAMVVSFQRDDQTVSTCVRVRAGQQSSTDYCP